MNKDAIIATSLSKLGIVYFYKRIENKIEILGFTDLKSAILFLNSEYEVCNYALSKKLKELGVYNENTEFFD